MYLTQPSFELVKTIDGFSDDLLQAPDAMVAVVSSMKGPPLLVQPRNMGGTLQWMVVQTHPLLPSTVADWLRTFERSAMMDLQATPQQLTTEIQAIRPMRQGDPIRLQFCAKARDGMKLTTKVMSSTIHGFVIVENYEAALRLPPFIVRLAS